MASFIWKFNKDEDNRVEMSVFGAFYNEKHVAGAEVCNYSNYCDNIINALALEGESA